MSWAEIKKINSNIKEPLNYILWLNDLALYGENGFVYKNPEYIVELTLNSQNAVNNEIAVELLLDATIKSGSHVGSFLKKVSNSNDDVFDGLSTIESVVGSSAAITILASSSKAMKLIANSSLTMKILALNSTAMATLSNNLIAVEQLFSSWVAREIIWNNPTTACDILFNSANLSLSWIKQNVQQEISKTGIGFETKVNGKCVILGQRTSHTTEGASWSHSKYGYVLPNYNIIERNNTTWSDVYQRCNALSLEGGRYISGTTVEKTCFVRCVQMQKI